MRNLVLSAAASACLAVVVAPPPPPPADAHDKYWVLLWRLPVNNHVKVFAVRLLHAALPCGAMRFVRRGGHAHDAYCPCCCPAQPRTRDTLLTYSHLFVQCPTYAPAIAWLQDLWEHLEGVRPPADARVLVADQPGAWPEAPPPSSRKGRLWSVLRLTLLSWIWSAYVSNDPAQQTAAAVVRATIDTVRSEITVAYGRHTFERFLVNAVAPRFAAMRRSKPANNHFEDFWLPSGLCAVHDDAGAAGGQGGAQEPRPRLVLRLSETTPVPAPP